MTPPRIRPLVICVFRRLDHILVFESYDSVKQETGYRPVGGGIEFGEYSQAALVREIREELHAEVMDLQYLGALENIFTLEGQPSHEIVIIYDGVFVDTSLYERDVIVGYEEALDLKFQCYWKSLTFFQRGEARLYPDGLLELLTR